MLKHQNTMCTNSKYRPQEILEWFARRWQIEVTFKEVRRHLGLETQRQWSEKRDRTYHASDFRIIFFSYS